VIHTDELVVRSQPEAEEWSAGQAPPPLRVELPDEPAGVQMPELLSRTDPSRLVTGAAIARRAFEISMTHEGGGSESNWARAEAELRNQRDPFP
jgi:hypothetical protein